ncbi:MAG: hypothetical protein AB1847_06630 [bacterium]
MELTRPPMSEASRNRLERRMYLKENKQMRSIRSMDTRRSMQSAPKSVSGVGSGKGGAYTQPQEGIKLDIVSERLRETETSRGWAIRQVCSLHREMRQS